MRYVPQQKSKTEYFQRLSQYDRDAQYWPVLVFQEEIVLLYVPPSDLFVMELRRVHELRGSVSMMVFLDVVLLLNLIISRIVGDFISTVWKKSTQIEGFHIEYSREVVRLRGIMD